MAAKPNNMPQAVPSVDNIKSDWIATDRSMTKYFQMQLFITGLQDKIQKELMKNTYTNFKATYEATLDLEVTNMSTK
jgi:hypothetical protein